MHSILTEYFFAGYSKTYRYRIIFMAIINGDAITIRLSATDWNKLLKA